METRTKADVVDPRGMLSTVGMELNNILIQNNSAITEFEFILGKNDICSIEKITKPNLKKICTKAKFDSCIFDYLLTFQQDYLQKKKKLQEAYKYSLKLFHSLEKKLNILIANDNFGGMDRLEDYTIFLDVDDEREIDAKIEKITTALYKQSCGGEYDHFNLYAWLRKGEIDFKRLTYKPYNCEALQAWVDSKVWRNQLSDTLSLINTFAEFGVALIYTPSLRKVPYGATRWFENTPLIQISDREKDLAIFWKVLFHEIGHVIKHKGITSLNNNPNKVSSKKIEKEADDFAKHYIYNGDKLRTCIFNPNLKKIDSYIAKQLAAEFDVDDMFVYYWARKAGKIEPYAYIKKFEIHK